MEEIESEVGGWIPDNIQISLELYKDEYVPCGGFLTAVLENDLIEAVIRADPQNRKLIPEIVNHMRKVLPTEAYGSSFNVNQWLRRWRPYYSTKEEEN